mgnify:CR=1 FL=1
MGAHVVVDAAGRLTYYCTRCALSGRLAEGLFTPGQIEALMRVVAHEHAENRCTPPTAEIASAEAAR